MAEVFDYLEYREYLRDYYQEQKRKKSFFSYRLIGLKVGMDSSYVIKVLQGSLHIPSKKIEKFIKLLNLNEAEADYFEALVHFCRAKTERQRKLYYDKLFAVPRVKSQRVDPRQYEFFHKWQYSAIWSIINCAPFQGDFRLLAKQCRPAIPVWEAKEAVKVLERLELLLKDSLGRYTTKDLNLTTGRLWHSYVIENYQREMIGLAEDTIGRGKKGEQDISTVTLCVDDAIIGEVQNHIRQFRTSLIKLVNSHGGTRKVYQLNVQLFPMSADLGSVE